MSPEFLAALAALTIYASLRLQEATQAINGINAAVIRDANNGYSICLSRSKHLPVVGGFVESVRRTELDRLVSGRIDLKCAPPKLRDGISR